MAIKSYLIELTTEIPVVIDDKEVTATKNLYQMVMDKTQEVMDNYDLNNSKYKVKVIGER
jgi:hypothetical protein